MRPVVPPTRRSRWAWSALYAFEHFAGSGPLAERARAIRSRLADGPSSAARFDPVPRLEGLDPERFHHEFVRAGRPVVLAGAARQWPAVRKWSPEWLADRYGAQPVRVMNASLEDFDRSSGWVPSLRTVTLGEVVRSITRGEGEYSRFLPLLHEFPELADDFDGEWLASLRGQLSGGRNYQLFVGGPQSSTALHNAIGSNLFVQVYGEKRWHIVDPRFTPRLDPEMHRSPYFFSSVDLESPDVQGIQGWEVVLQPGDVLYNPPFYWHQVRNLTATIGVGFRFYAPGPILRASKTFALLTLAARNPPVWQAMRDKRDFTQVVARAR